MAQGDALVPIILDDDDDYFVLPDAAYARRSHHGFHRDDDANSSFRFYPPLYKQRYSRVIEEVKERIELVDKVADFGCADGSFLRRIRDDLGRSVTAIIGVDIDETEVSFAEQNLKTDDFDYDDFYYFASPAITYLFQGSIAEYDDRLCGTDCVIAIELIEHLLDDVLRGAVEMIFSRMRPYMVIFTTPNVEFNVLFNMGDRPFRHDDHKFEWTRKEFETWCNGIVSTYQKYKVEFSGIGAGPEGTAESIGCASQMAVFRWKSRSSYLRLKDERSKAVRAKLANNPKYVYQHMQGEIATDENSGEHEHPYKFVARLRLTSQMAERRARQRAVNQVRDYCRQIYHEHLEQLMGEGSDISSSEIIVTDPETGIKGMWFNAEELFTLDLVKEVCKEPSDVGSLLAADECFLMDGGGFAYVCKRVMYRDEDDLCNYNNRHYYESEEENENPCVSEDRTESEAALESAAETFGKDENELNVEKTVEP